MIIIFESEVRAIPTRIIQTTPRDVFKDSDELDKDLKSKNWVRQPNPDGHDNTDSNEGIEKEI